jgi:acyl carrier protein
MGMVTIQQAVDAINEVLGGRGPAGRPVEAEDRLEDLGLDSLDVAELFLSLEAEVGRELDPASAGALERVRDLAELRALEASG